MSLSHKTAECIKEITDIYKAKDNSVKPPEIYLGTDISKLDLPGGKEVWATSPRSYVKNSIQVIESLLEEDGEGYVLKS